MKIVGVREAEMCDATSWANMRAALWPEASAAELADEVERHFTEAPIAAAVFVCETESGAAGFLELSLRSYAEGCTSSPVPYVEGWYVVPAQQRHGIGRRLLDAAEAWSRTRGYTEIASDCVLSNTASADVHRRTGFSEVERAIHFRKPLE